MIDYRGHAASMCIIVFMLLLDANLMQLFIWLLLFQNSSKLEACCDIASINPSFFEAIPFLFLTHFSSYSDGVVEPD